VRIIWTKSGWADYEFWVDGKNRSPKNVKRIHALIKDIIRDPFVTDGGIGKPEVLLGNLAGLSSRRIDQTHRLVYKVDGEDLIILQARQHY
jgi:toxin YoeB